MTAKTKAQLAARIPAWVRNLEALMERRNFNPRSLSLRAGLNATAVRDMLEGRSRFPRYDTVQSLAAALETTPALLMGDNSIASEVAEAGLGKEMDLLTEVITRLQEVITETGRELSPRDFAAMTMTIFKRMQSTEDRKKKISEIRPQIHDLLDYELLRKKSNIR
jgi:transcriptional regulator with XRE-family HTH domain